MDGSPQLLTNIQFAEAKKGYDRGQVDNFLRELSVKIGELQDMLRQATQRAESAEARASDAAKGRNAVETDLAALREELGQVQHELAAANEAAATAPAPGTSVESATGVLALAQKTADAAVADAEAQASDLLADAKSRAAMVVLEAEQDASRLKREAIDEADSLRASRVSRMEAEVDKLVHQRDGLQTDIDVLSTYVDQHRSALRQHATSIGQLLDAPGPLQLPPRPELVGEVPDLARRRTGAAAEERATQVPNLLEAPAVEATDAVDVTTDAREPAEGDADETGSADDPADVARTDDPAAALAEPAFDEPALAPAALDDDHGSVGSNGVDEATFGVSQPLTETAAPWTGEPAGDDAFAPGGHQSVQPVPEQAGQQAVQSSLIDLTAARLFDDHGGESTQQFDVLAEAAPEDAGEGIVSTGSAPSSPLGEPDAQADEAMRAFFEADKQQSDDTGERRGFLRRK